MDPTTHHIFLIQQGEATLVTGGKLVGKAIEGGQNNRLNTGDMIVVPARTPYWWKDVPSGSVGYLAVDKETPESGNTWGLPDVVQLINANRIKTRMTEPGGVADPLLIGRALSSMRSGSSKTTNRKFIPITATSSY